MNQHGNERQFSVLGILDAKSYDIELRIYFENPPYRKGTFVGYKQIKIINVFKPNCGTLLKHIC